MKHIVTDEKSAVKYVEMILKDWEVWQTHHTGLVEAMKILVATNEKLTEENKKLRKPSEVAREIFEEIENNTFAYGVNFLISKETFAELKKKYTGSEKDNGN